MSFVERIFMITPEQDAAIGKLAKSSDVSRSAILRGFLSALTNPPVLKVAVNPQAVKLNLAPGQIVPSTQPRVTATFAPVTVEALDFDLQVEKNAEDDEIEDLPAPLPTPKLCPHGHVDSCVKCQLTEAEIV